MNITFLGLGAMGSRMVKHLIESDHEVTLWNRSPEAYAQFKNASVTIALSPAEAVTQADAVFCMVRDDQASREVWLEQETGALHAMKPKAIAVECSTLSLPYVRELSQLFTRLNRSFLDIPLAGSRPQAEQKQLIFVAGGKAQAVAAVEPLMLQMGAAIHHLGEVGAGTTVKLMINALLGTQLALMAELMGFADKNNLAPETAMECIANTPVCSPALKMAAGAMISGQFAPSFPIDLVEKDFSLLGVSAELSPTSMPITAATTDVYRQAIKEGFGKDNITGIIQRYLTFN